MIYKVKITILILCLIFIFTSYYFLDPYTQYDKKIEQLALNNNKNCMKTLLTQICLSKRGGSNNIPDLIDWTLENQGKVCM